MDNKWMQDPTLSAIDPEKLTHLSSLASQGEQLNQKQLLPFLLAAASKSDKQNMNFSSVETQAILSVLKKNKSQKEQEKIDRLVQMFQKMQNRTPY